MGCPLRDMCDGFLSAKEALGRRTTAPTPGRYAALRDAMAMCEYRNCHDIATKLLATGDYECKETAGSAESQ